LTDDPRPVPLRTPGADRTRGRPPRGTDQREASGRPFIELRPETRRQAKGRDPKKGGDPFRTFGAKLSYQAYQAIERAVSRRSQPEGPAARPFLSSHLRLPRACPDLPEEGREGQHGTAAAKHYRL